MTYKRLPVSDKIISERAVSLSLLAKNGPTAAQPCVDEQIALVYYFRATEKKNTVVSTQKSRRHFFFSEEVNLFSNESPRPRLICARPARRVPRVRH